MVGIVKTCDLLISQQKTNNTRTLAVSLKLFFKVVNFNKQKAILVGVLFQSIPPVIIANDMFVIVQNQGMSLFVNLIVFQSPHRIEMPLELTA